MTPDIHVFLVNFPGPGEEMVIPNEDASYTIIINARLSHERQLEAYCHALRHIGCHDFEKDSVQEIEFENHARS